MKEQIREGFIRVSDIASSFAGYGKVPQNILDYAADRGERCHSIISDLLNDIVVKEERYNFCGKSIKGYVESFEKFWKPYEGSKIILQEERLYDENLMITGTPDLIACLHGEITLVDWKCTRDVGRHWTIQAAGYAFIAAANNLPIIRKIIFVKLDKDGSEPIVTEYLSDLDLFMNAYEFYKMFFKDQTCNLEMD